MYPQRNRVSAALPDDPLSEDQPLLFQTSKQGEPESSRRVLPEVSQNLKQPNSLMYNIYQATTKLQGNSDPVQLDHAHIQTVIDNNDYLTFYTFNEDPYSAHFKIEI